MGCAVKCMLKKTYTAICFSLVILITSSVSAISENVTEILNETDVCRALGYIQNTEFLEIQQELNLSTRLLEQQKTISKNLRNKYSNAEAELQNCSPAGPVNYGVFITQYKKKIQDLLNRKGCEAGKIDGIFGKQTITAARRFARAERIAFKDSDVYTEAFYKKLSLSSRRCPKTQISAPTVRGSKQCEFNPTRCGNAELCRFAVIRPQNRWSNFRKAHATEAKRRGLSCGVRN